MFKFLKIRELKEINALNFQIKLITSDFDNKIAILNEKLLRYNGISDIQKEVENEQQRLEMLRNDNRIELENQRVILSEQNKVDQKKHYEELLELNITIEGKKNEISASQEKLRALSREYHLALEKEVREKNIKINILNGDFIKLNTQYRSALTIYKALAKEVNQYETKIEFMDFGIYVPVYDFEKPDDYRYEQDKIIEIQREMIQSETAATCRVNWTIDGSESKGRASTKRYIKLALRAFNGECNALVSKIKWNNFNQVKERIQKAFETINKLGESQTVRISNEYLDLKMKEVILEYEYQIKKQEEKDKMRAIQDEIREEEKALRDFEKAQREAEKEESYFQKAIEKAKKEIGLSDPIGVEKLKIQISDLQQQLLLVLEKKERALSMAQQTKRGHVYIISNIGSFGENVYKIGMTRRLEPIDRVRELGDASVPFQFDVHAMIYSDEARTLEYELHKAFSNEKVNMLNYRKEFFNVTLEQIEDTIKKLGFEAEFTKFPEAMQYRETKVLLAKNLSNATNKNFDDFISDQFPNNLLINAD